MHAKISKLAGAGKVIVNDVNPERLAIARQLDASFITIAGDPGAELEKLTGGQGADVIITACPSRRCRPAPSSWRQSMAA